MLLVLDNIEHLLDQQCRSFLSDLVHDAASLKLLITSRERLNLQAETLLTIRGLLYPTGSANADNLEQFDAVQLFVSRAQKLRQDFDLPGHESAIMQLCQLVDGMPLALELAATWIRVMSLPEIVAEIQRNQAVLATTMHDVPVRHRSLQAVFDYSWTLLNSAEKDAFTKLAVFRGGFTRTAARAVADADLLLLTNLVDKSLLRVNQDDDGQSRYRRHPLLLQYAIDKLDASPGKSIVWDGYARYYGSFLRQLEPDLFGGQPEHALSLIRSEVENIKRAWHWATQQHDATVINQMSDSIMRAFDLSGLYRDAETMGRDASSAFATTDLDQPDNALALGRALGLAGAFQFRLGAYEEAHALCQQSLAVLESHQPHIAYAHSLIYLGAAYWGLGNFEAVRSNWLAANDAYKAVDSIWGQAVALTNLSELEVFLGQNADARHYAEAGYALAQSMGDNELMGGPLQVMSNLALAEGDLARAQQYAEEAVICHRKTGHQAHLANALAVLGHVTLAQNRPNEARDHLLESVAILEDCGNHLYLLEHLIELGHVQQILGDLDDAEATLAYALDKGIQANSFENSLHALGHLATVYAQQKQFDKAVVLAAFVANHETAIADVQLLANQVLQTARTALDATLFKTLCQQAESATLSDLATPIRRHV
jgi:predicted ATPase